MSPTSCEEEEAYTRNRVYFLIFLLQTPYTISWTKIVIAHMHIWVVIHVVLKKFVIDALYEDKIQIFIYEIVKVY